MKCNIRGDKLEITSAIKEYVEEKIGRLNKYFKNEELESNILVKVNGNRQIIEVTIPMSKYTLRAEQESDDLYAAIDLVTEKLERQIRKNKTKLQRRTSHVEEFNFDYEVLDEEPESKVVKRKKLESKPMDEEEAIIEMELIGHDFYAYKDMDKNNKVCVVYKRKDGNYGIIETE